MPLTPRAVSWLSTLTRIPAVPTRVVEQRILDAGHTPHRVWLEFHDNYAGYIEEVAPGDLAFWGLSHAANRNPPVEWAEPDKVFVIPAHGANSDGITCADAHPVHDYILLASGMFLGAGGPTDTFDRKIERAALMHEFLARGKVSITHHGKDLTDPVNQQLLTDMQPHFVPEASHGGTEYYADTTRLLVVSRKSNRLALREVATP